MNNPETQAKNPGEQPQQASQWDSLSDHGKEIKEEKERAKEFTRRELQRLASAVNRTPDDEGVIKLNLVLRYEEYKMMSDSVQMMKQKGIMVQQGTLEDLATSKRELEEAMYLYDPTFAKDDAKTESINEDQHKADTKDYLRGDKHNSEGEPGTGKATTGNSWVKARMARRESYDKKRGLVSEHRDQASQRLADNLGDISRQFKNEIIGSENLWDTYSRNRGSEPQLRERRLGYDGAGKSGLFGAGASKGKNIIDWTLYPRAPKDIDESELKRIWEHNLFARYYQRKHERETTQVDPNPVPPDPEPTQVDPNPVPPDPEPDPTNPKPFGELPPAPKPFGILPPAPEPPEEPETPGPLVGVNIDHTWDAKDLARHFAKEELNTEAKSTKNIIKRIWKHNLFARYYQRKYEREIFEGEREVTIGGKQTNIYTYLASRNETTRARIARGMTEEGFENLIYRNVGGEGQGEKVTEVDAKTTEVFKGLISKFAEAEIPEGGSLEDTILNLRNDAKRLIAESRDRGDNPPLNASLLEQCCGLAIQAREYVEHGASVGRVMEGFKLYNADVRNNARTQEHRDGIDRLVDKYENSRFGQFIPPEIIAGVLGSVVSLTQTAAKTGSKALLGTGVGAGAGIAISSATQFVRERGRIIEDRATMQKNLAVNRAYEGSKYETRIGGTMYDLRPANELTANLANAVESGDRQSILNAIAEARVRVRFSDSEQKDLIAYSSEEKISDERLALDVAIAEAVRSLSEEDREGLNDVEAVIQNKIVESVDEKDANFNKTKNALALKQAAKTALVGAVTFFASQEIRAIIDPSRIGALEKIAERHGIIIRPNNEDAKETILATIGGRGENVVMGVSGDDAARMEELNREGYSRVLARDPSVQVTYSDEQINLSDTGTNTKFYDFDWFNNGTAESDGAELRLYYDEGVGYHTRMSGYVSTTAGGRIGNFAQDVSRPNGIGGFIELENGEHYQIEHEIVNGEVVMPVHDGYLQTVDGVNIPLGPNGEAPGTIFVASIDDVRGDGYMSVTSYAAEHYDSSWWDGTVTVSVPHIEETPAIYDFVRERDIDTGGVTLPFAPRPSLGRSQGQTPSGQPVPPGTGGNGGGNNPPIETPPGTGGNGGGNNPPIETPGGNGNGGETPPTLPIDHDGGDSDLPNTPGEGGASQPPEDTDDLIDALEGDEEEERARREEEERARREEEERARREEEERARREEEERARREAQSGQGEIQTPDGQEALRRRKNEFLSNMSDELRDIAGRGGILYFLGLTPAESASQPDVAVQYLRESWRRLPDNDKDAIREFLRTTGNEGPYREFGSLVRRLVA